MSVYFGSVLSILPEASMWSHRYQHDLWWEANISDHNHNIIVTVAAADANANANAATSAFCIVVVAAVDVVIAVFPNWALSFHPVSFLSHHNRVIIILLWKRWAMHLNWLCSVLAHSYNVYVCSVRRIHNGTNSTCPEFELRIKREMRADVVMVVCTTPHTLYADHKHLTWFIRIITYLWWIRWCGPTVDAFSHLFSKHVRSSSWPFAHFPQSHYYRSFAHYSLYCWILC